MHPASFQIPCIPRHSRFHASRVIPDSMHPASFQIPCIPRHSRFHASRVIPDSMHPASFQIPCIPRLGLLAFVCWILLKETRSEDASRPENVRNVQMFPPGCSFLGEHLCWALHFEMNLYSSQWQLWHCSLLHSRSTALLSYATLNE